MIISVLSIVVLVLTTMLVVLVKFSLDVYKSNLALIKTCEDLGKHCITFVKLYDKYRDAESSADKTEAAKNILDTAQDVNNTYYRELELYKQRHNE